VIRVLVQPAVTSFGTAVTIYQEPSESDGYGGPRRVLHLPASDDGHTGVRGERWDEVKVCEQFEPTLILEDDFLRPLCDALVHYFTGTEDTRALRADYDAERKRTDKLIDHLAAVTRSLAEPQP